MSNVLFSRFRIRFVAKIKKVIVDYFEEPLPVRSLHEVEENFH